MNRTQLHLSGRGPDAPNSAGVTGGTGRQTVLPNLRKGRFWPRRHRSRGQTLIEFTLILPVVLLLTVGIVDAARLFAAQISLTNGVREAALYAGEGGYTRWCAPPPAPTSIPCPAGAKPANQVADPQNLAFHIQGEAVGMDVAKILLEPPVCNNDTSIACSSASDSVRITATYPFEPLNPIISLIMSRTLTGHAALGQAVWITASTSATVQR